MDSINFLRLFFYNFKKVNKSFANYSFNNEISKALLMWFL